jgi:hypothetical protein
MSLYGYFEYDDGEDISYALVSKVSLDVIPSPLTHYSGRRVAAQHSTSTEMI